MCSHKIAIFKAESNDKEIDPYAQIFIDQGINATIIPTLTFNFINTEILLRHLCTDYEGIIFTSTRSVEAVNKLWSEDLLSKWEDKDIFSVGESTSKLATSLLKLNSLGEHSGNSQELCSFIFSYYKESQGPKRLLFPSSSKSRDTITKILEGNGFTINEVTCYETICNPDIRNCWGKYISTQGLPSVVVFFSPSGVEFSHNLIKESYSNTSLPKFIAIGPSTEQALINVDMPACKTATKPNPISIWEAVQEIIL